MMGLKGPNIPVEDDSSRQQSFQPFDPNSINMQQAHDGQLPPAYAPNPTAAPIPMQPLQPQQAHFQQGQFAQPQQEYFIKLPDGTMQAVTVQPQQPIMMTPTKEQPTIIVNNAPSASAAAAGGGGGGGGGGNSKSSTDACLAGFCGGCAACLCCSVM